MSINNMGQSLNIEPLPGTLQARIDNALHQLESCDAETRRLEKYIQKEKGQIDLLTEQKSTLESKIEKLNEEVLTLTSKTNEANTNLESILHQLSDAKHSVEELNKEAEIIATNNSTNLILQASRENDLEKREQVLDARIAKQNIIESEYQKKVERLQEAIK